MNFFLTMAYLFFVGSLLGWGLEVLFRRFFSSSNPEKKWVNPGFLTGPYLPLYGFGLCFLFLIAQLEQLPLMQNPIANKLCLFALMAIAMTAVEYIAGLIFVRGMKTKLWDYSDEWGNIQGIICPRFSFFWAVLGAVYYFAVHPHIRNGLEWLSQNLAFSFFIGLFFGIFFMDFAHSTQLVVKIRKFAKDNEIIVRYEELKAHIKETKEELRGKKSFFFTLQAVQPISEHLRVHLERQREHLEKLQDMILPKK